MSASAVEQLQAVLGGGGDPRCPQCGTPVRAKYMNSHQGETQRDMAEGEIGHCWKCACPMKLEDGQLRPFNAVERRRYVEAGRNDPQLMARVEQVRERHEREFWG